MKSSRRKFEAQSINKVLDEIVHSKALKNGINNAKVNQLWIELMGENINRYTDKIVLDKSNLSVFIRSSALKEELTYGKEKIIKLINNALGETIIKKLILR